MEPKYRWFIRPQETQEAHLLIENGKIIPDRKPDGSPTRGVYAWYLQTAQLQVPKCDYFSVDGFKLLYIGIAGDKNKPNSKATLRRRIRGEHLCGNAFSSSLRLSLGVVLSEYLNLKLLPTTTGYEWSDEQALTEWLAQNALVTWITHEKPWELEEEIVQRHGAVLPLNYEYNKGNPFAASLHAKKIELRGQIREARAGQ